MDTVELLKHTEAVNKQKTQPALLRGASGIGEIRALQYFTSTISNMDECLIKANFYHKQIKAQKLYKKYFGQTQKIRKILLQINMFLCNIK